MRAHTRAIAADGLACAFDREFSRTHWRAPRCDAVQIAERAVKTIAVAVGGGEFGRPT